MATKELMQKIIEKQDEYIKMLGDEINDVFGMAYIHGWRSTRVEQGEKMRSDIASLKSQLAEVYKDCIYHNEEGGCWSIKAKCDPQNENCDYRKKEQLAEAGEEVAKTETDSGILVDMPDLCCDVCGRHPSVIIRNEFGTFCREHAKYI